MEISIALKLLEKLQSDYEKIAEEYSETRSKPWQEFEKFKEYIKDGDRILDLGCGNGRLLETLKDKNIEYIGLDSSPKLIEIAKERLKALSPESKANFLVGNVLNLPFEDKSFDKIFCWALFHHIPSEELRIQVLKEIKRVLKEDDLLMISNWNLWQLKYLPTLIKYFFLKLFGRIILDYKDVLIPWKSRKGVVYRYYHAFTMKELEELFKKMEFKILEKYYSKKGKRSSWLKGYNLIIVAKN